MAINPSPANWDNVRIAFEVVIFDMLAKSSRAMYIAIVAPSSSNP